MSTNSNHPAVASLLLGRTRGAVLALLYGHPDETFYLRQVVRLSGSGLGAVQRELKILTTAGILRRTVSGRQVYFQANSASPVYPEVKSFVAKTVGAGDVLRAALSRLAGRIRLAFIFGSVARGEEGSRSDLDLCIIGDASFSEIVACLQDAQMTLGREINPVVFPVEEFKSKLRENHPFAASLLREPKIFLIGDDHDLEGLGSKRLADSSRNQPEGNRRPHGRRPAGSS